MARANTIKRRINKKKMLEKVKSTVMEKLNVNGPQRFKKSTQQLRDFSPAIDDQDNTNGNTNNLNNVMGHTRKISTLNRTRQFQLNQLDQLTPQNQSNDKRQSIHYQSPRKSTDNVNSSMTNNANSNGNHNNVQNGIDSKESGNDQISGGGHSGGSQKRFGRKRHHQTDNNVILQLALTKDLKSAYEVNNSGIIKKLSKMIEDEEEFIYFQYNSDGEAMYDDNKSSANSFFNFNKQSTYKRMKTIQMDGADSGSFHKADRSQQLQEFENMNLSSNSNQKQGSTGKQPYEQLINPSSFQTLNQLLHRNPNVTFKLGDNQKTIKGGHIYHKKTADANIISQPTFGRYLTVHTNFSGVNRMKTEKGVTEEQGIIEQPILQQAKNNKVVVIRPLSTQRLELHSSKQTNDSTQASQNKKYPNIVAIEEEMSEHSSPAIHTKKFSFKRPLMIADSSAMVSGENSQNYSRQTSDMLMSEQYDQTPGDVDSEGRNIRKFTSFLTLNRYNKIYTQEFREEDVEIMNINSNLKQQNAKLEKLASLQVILVFIGFLIFVIDTESYHNNTQDYDYNMENFSLTKNSNMFYFCNSLRALHTILCVVQITVTLIYYNVKAKIARIRKIFPKNFPRVYGQTYFIQSLTAVLLQLKFFTIIRYIGYKSPLNSNKGRFIVALRGIDYTSAFLVKVWLTMNPIKGLSLGISFFLIINSYIMLLNERKDNLDSILCYNIDRHDVRITQYRDSLWLTIVTFLTIGYGDFYPTTNLGRYVMILTAMGGQLCSALVIGLIHGQLMLTSEESGVLNIISNNRKEKSKRVVAATLIYYILKMAGSRNKLLQKGNIHWYKTREVHSIKFEIYVNVMRFKRIKHELASYYSTRGNDNNLNIIKNTENQLALLATEVITIFDLMKDSKLERKKNINESYFRRRSMIQKIIEQETSVLGGNGGKVKMQATRIRSEGTLARMIEESPSPNEMNKNSLNNVNMQGRNSGVKIHKFSLESARRQSVRPSKTMKMPTKFQNKFMNKNWNKKVDKSSIEEESESNEGSSANHTSSSNEDSLTDNNRKSKRLSTKKLSSYATNFRGGLSIADRMQERKKQQKIQQKLTNITQSNTSSYLENTHAIQGQKPSPQQKRSNFLALSHWKNITSVDSLKALSYDEIDAPNISTKKLSQASLSNKNDSFFSPNNLQNAIQQISIDGNGVGNGSISPQFKDSNNSYIVVDGQQIKNQSIVVKSEENHLKKQKTVLNQTEEIKLPTRIKSNIDQRTSTFVDQSTSPISNFTQASFHRNSLVPRSSTEKVKGDFKRFKSHDVNHLNINGNGTPKNKQNTLRSGNIKSSSSRRSSGLLKSNTQVITVTPFQKQLSITSKVQSRLKQQKTQIEPQLVSIIEEEETFSEDDEGDFQMYDEVDEDGDVVVGRERMEEIAEENTSYDREIDDGDADQSQSQSQSGDEDEGDEDENSVSDATQSDQHVIYDVIQRPHRGSVVNDDLIKDSLQTFSEFATLDKRQHSSQSFMTNGLQDPQQLFKQKSISSYKSSLGQVFDEYKRKQDLSKNLNILNKIYENYSINTKQTKGLGLDFLKAANQFIDEQYYEDISTLGIKQKSQFDTSLSAGQHSKSRIRLNSQSYKPSGSGDSFYVSEDQFTSSQKSSRSPLKIPGEISNLQQQLQQNYKNDNTLQVQKHPQKIKTSPLKQAQSQIQQLQTSQVTTQLLQIAPQDPDIGLSPIYPLRKKSTTQNQFQLELKRAVFSNNTDHENNMNVVLDPKYKSQQTQKLSHIDPIIAAPQLDLIELIEKLSQHSPSLSHKQKASILSFQEQINQILKQRDPVNYDQQTPLDTSNMNNDPNPILNNDQQPISEPQSYSPRDSSISDNIRSLISPQKSPILPKKGKPITNKPIPINKSNPIPSPAFQNTIVLENEKDQLKEEVKKVEEEMQRLYSKMESTENLVLKTVQEAKNKILKLKQLAQIQGPTLQVNVINNVSLQQEDNNSDKDRKPKSINIINNIQNINTSNSNGNTHNGIANVQTNVIN